jgi:hypothetical protein
MIEMSAGACMDDATGGRSCDMDPPFLVDEAMAHETWIQNFRSCQERSSSLDFVRQVWMPAGRQQPTH